jgi:hypothetical protein
MWGSRCAMPLWQSMQVFDRLKSPSHGRTATIFKRVTEEEFPTFCSHDEVHRRHGALKKANCRAVHGEMIDRRRVLGQVFAALRSA